MAILPDLSQKLSWTLHSLRFIKKHLLLILFLGLVAGLGRAAQLRAFGPISPMLDTFLEIVIQTARILIFLFSLGLTNIKKGINRFLKIFSPQTSDRPNWKTALTILKQQWIAVVLNISAFMVIAFLINLLIDHIAYETCLYATLRADGIISSDSSEWSIILFLKNISIIPLTLVFNATLLLWFVNRVPQQVSKA
ncbi:hypothetical protein [Dyadobacter sp. CY323]|uniref:hypothetical protein n=1 Tax=Dyadobacter sp. CY323 TaxID=2907302 RepID=UPI001F3C6653|nr:hypothetical protein [Dyadobacter sp. CY323]MCE6992132.1 hypothetical protein [Dyadobacter sp. CY323]